MSTTTNETGTGFSYYFGEFQNYIEFLYNDHMIYLLLVLFLLTNIKSYYLKDNPSIVAHLLNLPIMIFHDGIRHLTAKSFRVEDDGLGFNSFQSLYRTTATVQYKKDKEEKNRLGHFFIFISPLLLLIPLIFFGFYEEETISFIQTYITESVLYSHIIFFFIIFIFMEGFLPTFGELFDYIGIMKTIILTSLITLSIISLFYLKILDINSTITSIESFFKIFDFKVFLFIIIHYILIIILLFVSNIFNFRKK